MTRSRHLVRLASACVLLGWMLAPAVCGFGPATASQGTPTSDLVNASRLLSDLQVLSSDDMQGRRSGTAGAAMARKLIVQRFGEARLEPVGVSFEHPFPADAHAPRGVNVVGRVTGRATPDRYLVVSAHYDHMGIREGRVFNGANDNASGAAALSVIAEYFVRHRPAVSILFVAFDAEEQNLTGSRAFVAAPPVPAASILANVNLDMIGRDASETLWVTGVRRFPVFEAFVLHTAASAPIRIRMGHDGTPDSDGEDWTRDSDQFAFIEAGIPALYVGVEDYKFLHSPDDDFASMMPKFYVAAVDAIVSLLEGIDAGAEAIARSRTATAR